MTNNTQTETRIREEMSNIFKRFAWQKTEANLYSLLLNHWTKNTPRVKSLSSIINVKWRVYHLQQERRLHKTLIIIMQHSLLCTTLPRPFIRPHSNSRGTACNHQLARLLSIHNAHSTLPCSSCYRVLPSPAIEKPQNCWLHLIMAFW